MTDGGRRAAMLRLARAAGVAPLALGVLTGRVRALPRGEATDAEILSAALTIEHHAIALYGHALQHGLVTPGLRAQAIEFRGDHQGHRDTQVAVMQERGAAAPAARTDYDLAGLAAGDATLRALLAIEIAAQDAYTALISQIRTDDYLLMAAFILVDEVRHMTVWQRALGYAIY